jgi:hypothetical protein
MRRTILAAAAALLIPAPAGAAYMTYREWASLSPPERTLYIAGAFDQLTTIATPGDSAPVGVNPAQRYQACVARAGMTDAQLAENVRTFAAARSEVQALPVPVALMQYLAVTCGSL